MSRKFGSSLAKFDVWPGHGVDMFSVKRYFASTN